MKTKGNIKKEAYRLYQLDWMMRHGYGIEDIVSELDNKLPMTVDPYTDPMDISIVVLYGEWKQDHGFNGEIYVCYEEFLKDEYLDQEYMEELFDVSPNALELKKAYEVDLGIRKWYFTFGSDPGFPYQNTYLTVMADTEKNAIEKFRAKYPDRHKNCVNCTFWYSEEDLNALAVFGDPDLGDPEEVIR